MNEQMVFLWKLLVCIAFLSKIAIVLLTKTNYHNLK